MIFISSFSIILKIKTFFNKIKLKKTLWNKKKKSFLIFKMYWQQVSNKSYLNSNNNFNN